MKKKHSNSQYPIDVVIAWVDPTDEEWRKEKEYYVNGGKKPYIPEESAVAKGEEDSTIDNSEIRFRDWDTVRYIFRGIELYMPWVRTIHFITCGHLPKWLNVNHPKLHHVKHTDYLDERYLPTFSSHTIEINMHRIEGLAEHFIYFNDDMLVMKPCSPTDFFKNGLPRDYAVLHPAISSHRYSVIDTSITNIEIINDHFKKNEVILKNFIKWFHPCYGTNIFKTLLLMPWPKFANMYGRHLCHSYLKSTFQELWEKEYEVLDSTSSHMFRTRRDVNQWLMREWQLAKGDFIPISPNYGKYYYLKNDNKVMFDEILRRKYRIICINDNGAETIVDFDKTKKELIRVLQKVFPKKSSFEI